jgi:hypothetical protein
VPTPVLLLEILAVQVSLDNYAEWIQLVAQAYIKAHDNQHYFTHAAAVTWVLHLCRCLWTTTCTGSSWYRSPLSASTVVLSRLHILSAGAIPLLLQVSVDNYTEWIQLVAQLTIDSLNSWQWAKDSVYYLLGLWSR